MPLVIDEMVRYIYVSEKYKFWGTGTGIEAHPLSTLARSANMFTKVRG